MTLKERFEAKVEVSERGCWLWRVRGARYPRIKVEGQVKDKAHRVAWRLYRGEIPAGMQVLHAAHSVCGSKACVNPEHLHLGTQRDNVREAIAEGTHAIGNLRRGSQAGEPRRVGTMEGSADESR